MESLSILSLILVVSLATAFNLRVPGIEPKEAIFHPRIVNGKTAALNEFPYQVGLEFDRGNKGITWCGGALIANEWVLTSAHCTLGAGSVSVQLGMINQFDPAIEYIVKKSQIFVHPDHNEDSARADIALIQIPHVNYTSAIQPIALPRKASTYPDYVGTAAVASGWGFTSDNATDLSSSLQYATLKVISNSKCEKYYDKDSIYSGKICTGGTSTDVCIGDSGDPLVLRSKKTLIGISSFAPSDGCGKGNPAAFTRVDFYLDWIKRKTKL